MWFVKTLILFFFVAGVFISCSDDEPFANCENLNYSTDFIEIEDAIAQAQVNHLLDGSNENCIIVKDLILEYIDMLEAIEDCELTPFEQSDYEDTLTRLRSDLDSLSC